MSFSPSPTPPSLHSILFQCSCVQIHHTELFLLLCETFLLYASHKAPQNTQPHSLHYPAWHVIHAILPLFMSVAPWSIPWVCTFFGISQTVLSVGTTIVQGPISNTQDSPKVLHSRNVANLWSLHPWSGQGHYGQAMDKAYDTISKRLFNKTWPIPYCFLNVNANFKTELLRVSRHLQIKWHTFNSDI